MHAYKQTNNGKRRCHAKRFSSQSAMEYLMTYGWAILIIAVVLAALFELGVFNPYTFAAKAQPGSCSVYRPDGAGTNNFISLLGPCTNEIPQYAAQFNGQNSNVSTSLPTTAVESVSINVWAYIPSVSDHGAFVKLGPGSDGGYGIGVGGDNWDSSGNQLWALFEAIRWIDCGTNIGTGWHFITLVLNSSGVPSCYLDGRFITSVNGAGAEPPTSALYIGSDGAILSRFFTGDLANVQIYNTALSQPDIQALYKEGIGGVPIDLNNLVGWWPLNGNANDYSGNGNNGNAINVSFTGGWYKGYAAP